MDIKLADSLLQEWYEWSRQWRPDLGVPRRAPYCREFYTSGGWEYEADQAEAIYHRKNMEAIDFCVSSLPSHYSRAIGLEMRKRHGAAREWRNGCSGISYQKAILALLPKLAEQYLI